MIRILLLLCFVGCTCALPNAPINRPTPTASPVPPESVPTRKPFPTSMPPIEIPPVEQLMFKPSAVIKGQPVTVSICGHASFELINLYVDSLYSSKMSFEQKTKCHAAVVTLSQSKVTIEARVGSESVLARVYIEPLDR